jgi:predicted nucleic acid-binding protein
MDWVTDCSFTAALFLPDEGTPAARRFFRELGRHDAVWVPGLWWLETANVMTLAVRRRRITAHDARLAMALFGQMSLQTDPAHGVEYLQTVTALAGETGLSAYDAAYIELAVRRNAGLASCDRLLLAAAQKAGVRTTN